MGYLPLLFLGRCVVAVGQLIAPMVGYITVRRKRTGKREIMRILIDTWHCRANLMMEVYQMTLVSCVVLDCLGGKCCGCAYVDMVLRSFLELLCRSVDLRMHRLNGKSAENLRDTRKTKKTI